MNENPNHYMTWGQYNKDPEKNWNKVVRWAIQDGIKIYKLKKHYNILVEDKNGHLVYRRSKKYQELYYIDVDGNGDEYGPFREHYDFGKTLLSFYVD